jgi:ATP-dependent HslUV protease subunit HslV
VLKKNGAVVMGADGQVSLGNTIIKGSAKKVRKIYNNQVLVGFAGAAADAFTLLDKLEAYLQTYSGDILRSCVELAKEWRSDKILRRLEAMILVASQKDLFLISGNGDILSPDKDIMAIGSGGNYAYSAGIALLENAPALKAQEIAFKSLSIAASICIYTNDHFTFETLGNENE